MLSSTDEQAVVVAIILVVIGFITYVLYKHGFNFRRGGL